MTLLLNQLVNVLNVEEIEVVGMTLLLNQLVNVLNVEEIEDMKAHAVRAQFITAVKCKKEKLAS